MRLSGIAVWLHGAAFACAACGGKSDPGSAQTGDGGSATSGADNLTGETGVASGGSTTVVSGGSAGRDSATGNGFGAGGTHGGSSGAGAGTTNGVSGSGGASGNPAGGSAGGGSGLGGSGLGGATGGTPASEGGTGGTSTGGAGGAESCIDVCELHGPACCTDGIGCVTAGDGCVIELLSARVDTIYEYAELEEEILTLPPDLQLSLTDADFTRVAFGPAPAARIGFVLSPEAEAAYGEMLEQPPYSHPFRLSCDGQSLFVGITYDLIGAAAIGTPVLHPVRTEEALELQLGAIQGAWLLSDLNVEVEARERIDRPELRAAFCRRGIVEPLDTDDGSP